MFKRTERFTETMKKTLLSLLAASLVGCIQPQFRTLSIFDQYDYQKPDNEEKVLGRAYTLKDQSEDCLRSHYIGMENDQLKSFTVTEHCLSKRSQNGSYSLFRFEDYDQDGYANTACVSRGTTYLGFTLFDPLQCTPLGNKMSQLMGLFNLRSMEEQVIPLNELKWDGE